jgi:hypothetical protein
MNLYFFKIVSKFRFDFDRHKKNYLFYIILLHKKKIFYYKMKSELQLKCSSLFDHGYTNIPLTYKNKEKIKTTIQELSVQLQRFSVQIQRLVQTSVQQQKLRVQIQELSIRISDLELKIKLLKIKLLLIYLHFEQGFNDYILDDLSREDLCFFLLEIDKSKNNKKVLSQSENAPFIFKRKIEIQSEISSRDILDFNVLEKYCNYLSRRSRPSREIDELYDYYFSTIFPITRCYAIMRHISIVVPKEIKSKIRNPKPEPDNDFFSPRGLVKLSKQEEQEAIRRRIDTEKLIIIDNELQKSFYDISDLESMLLTMNSLSIQQSIPTSLVHPLTTTDSLSDDHCLSFPKSLFEQDLSAHQMSFTDSLFEQPTTMPYHQSLQPLKQSIIIQDQSFLSHNIHQFESYKKFLQQKKSKDLQTITIIRAPVIQNLKRFISLPQFIENKELLVAKIRERISELQNRHNKFLRFTTF